MVTIILWLAMVIGIIIFPLFFSDYVQWAELEFGRIERGRQKSLLVVEVDQSFKNIWLDFLMKSRGILRKRMKEQNMEALEKVGIAMVEHSAKMAEATVGRTLGMEKRETRLFN